MQTYCSAHGKAVPNNRLLGPQFKFQFNIWKFILSFLFVKQ